MADREWILQQISEERDEQIWKWGDQATDPSISPYQWVAILGEEFGEAAQAALQFFDPNDPVGGSVEALEEELIQVAAVSVSFLEWLSRYYTGDDTTIE